MFQALFQQAEASVTLRSENSIYIGTPKLQTAAFLVGIVALTRLSKAMFYESCSEFIIRKDLLIISIAQTHHAIDRSGSTIFRES